MELLFQLDDLASDLVLEIEAEDVAGVAGLDVAEHSDE